MLIIENGDLHRRTEQPRLPNGNGGSRGDLFQRLHGNAPIFEWTFVKEERQPVKIPIPAVSQENPFFKKKVEAQLGGENWLG
jgi:hypothetical protein